MTHLNLLIVSLGVNATDSFPLLIHIHVLKCKLWWKGPCWWHPSLPFYHPHARHNSNNRIWIFLLSGLSISIHLCTTAIHSLRLYNISCHRLYQCTLFKQILHISAREMFINWIDLYYFLYPYFRSKLSGREVCQPFWFPQSTGSWWHGVGCQLWERIVSSVVTILRQHSTSQ